MYVESATLLLAYVFENLRKNCIEIYELNPAHFFLQPDSHWQACLKKTGEEFEILTNTDMLLMATEGIRSGKSQAIHRYTKASNKYMKKCNKNTKSLYLTRI